MSGFGYVLWSVLLAYWQMVLLGTFIYLEGPGLP